MELLRVNVAGRTQYRMLDGRKHLVVPVSMIVPGVLNGSHGPLFYSLQEISRNYDAWNNMPIVVDHPTDDQGNPVSARSAKILNKFGVGRVLNAKVNGKLIAEGWFDVEALRRVDNRILKKIQNGGVVELSTGLYTVDVRKESTHNGKRYKAIATDLRPDHLAVFADKVGACSLKDGCGVNVNQKTKQCDCADPDNCKCHRFSKILEREITNAIKRKPKGSSGGGQFTSGGGGGGSGGKGKSPGNDVPKKYHEDYTGTEEVDMPDGTSETARVFEFDSESKMSGFLDDVGGMPHPLGGKRAVLSGKPPAPKKAKVKLGFPPSKGGVQVKGFPIPRRNNSQFATNRSFTMNAEEREEAIDLIIANCDQYDDNDRDTLNKLDDVSLASAAAHSEELAANAARTRKYSSTTTEESEINLNDCTDEELSNELARREDMRQRRNGKNGDGKKKKTETTNTDISTVEWLEKAPPEVKELVRGAREVQNTEKSKIINELIANIDESKQKEHHDRLFRRNIEDLRRDLEIYRANHPVTNEEEEEEEEVSPEEDWINNMSSRQAAEAEEDMLIMETINFEDESRANASSERQDAMHTAQSRPQQRPHGKRGAVQYDALPESAKRAVTNAMRIEKREKDKVIAGLTANVKDEGQKRRLIERFSTKTLDELQDLAAIAGTGGKQSKRVANYSGASGNHSIPIINDGGDDDGDMLMLPQQDYSKQA